MVKKSTAIIILGFLFGVAVVILAIAYFQSRPVQDTLTVRQRQREIEQIVQDKGATLSFGEVSPVASGVRFRVPVVLSSPQFHIVGTDVTITYDPTLVEVVDVENANIFDTLLGTSIQNESGETTFSLMMEPEKDGFSGESEVAFVTMRSLTTGTATIGFDYTQGARNDTNVSAVDLPSEDVLEAVIPMTVIIQ